MNKPLTVVTDLDGTAVNVMAPFVDLYGSLFGVIDDSFCRHYDVAKSLWEQYPTRDIFVSEAAVARFLTTAVWTNPTVYLEANAYWDWIGSLITLSAYGAEVLILTGRPHIPQIVSVTEAWLRIRFGQVPKIYWKSQHPDGKLGCMREIVAAGDREVWYVDDEPDQCTEIAKGLPGVVVLIPNRPWTKDAYRESADPVAFVRGRLDR